uniref:Uncharacterized protein n=1 Tax=Arundo donax TaxID=35708 RepID=A0A0A9GAJ9_ARUDO
MASISNSLISTACYVTMGYILCLCFLHFHYVSNHIC